MNLIITSKELSILRRAAEGVAINEIGLLENISKREVDNQLKSVLNKLRSSNPLEALQELAHTNFKVLD